MQTNYLLSSLDNSLKNAKKDNETSIEMVNTSNMMPTGAKLGECHQVESYLGEGGFGFVTKCRNTETGKMVAIKVNKSHPDVIRQTRGEIAILKKLQCLDPDTCNIVKWNGFFFHEDNICLNFELMDQSLRDYMVDRNYQGLPVAELRPIVQQLTTALYYLSSIGIVHADLKPDNIMVVDRTHLPLKVKVIDFGLAHPVSAPQSGVYFQTTWYTAPEVMLQIPFDEGIDMWSLGLTAAELVAGVPMYPGETDYDMLSFIIETQGQPADDMLDRGQSTEFYFKKQNNSQRRWRLKTPEEFAKQTGYYGQETRWYKLWCLEHLRELMAETGDNVLDQCRLVDLIKRMLELDPHQRIKPMEVLQHRFFLESLSQSSSSDNSDTKHTGEETPEVSEQFYSYWTEAPENMHCSAESSCVDPCIEITDNAEETTEVTLQSCWSQTRGPENIQYWIESDNQSDQCLLVDSIKRILEVDPDQHIKPIEVLQHPVFPDSLSQSSSTDNSYTIQTEEATPDLDRAVDNETSFQMARNTSNMMPTGAKLGECYQVMSYLGEGGFGFVTKCRNTLTGKMVAIKVNKNHPNVIRQTRGEIAILEKLQCLDPDMCNIVKWNGFFYHEDNICLNFELMDQSLRDYMVDRNYQGLPVAELRPIVQQLTTALYYLSSIGIVHADLKPDNIMVVDRTHLPLKVKVIDFGLVHPVSAPQPGVYFQTTWYRAPEVMLQIPFDEGIDMWSLGLTAAELVAGVPLYPGKKDYDMLNFIIETQGQPADDMLDRGQSTEVFFKKLNNSQQRWRLKTPEEFAKQTGYYGQETRWYRLGCFDDLRELMAETGDSLRDQWLLMDLIKRMLELDPHQRIKPMEVLQHRFFPDSLSQSFSAGKLYTIHTEKETPEVSEQFYSYWTEGPENMPCCVKSSCVDSCIEITDNAEETTEVTLQSCWSQTRGPENIQYWIESDNQSDQCLLVDSIKRILEVDPDQHIKPIEVLQHPVFPDSLSQSSSTDNSYTIHTEEATPDLDRAIDNETSFQMARNTSNMMPTGAKLGECYEVMSYLGEGGFGFVTKCRNTLTGKMVAIKVNKNHPNVIRQTRGEIAILEKLQCLDPDMCNIVKWNGFFYHEDNICLNFELMDQSLRDYMVDRNYQGLPVAELRPIVQQLTTALYYLSSIGIVHADLKPDNIMVVDRTHLQLKVKVIDFGLAHPVSAPQPGVYFQTTWYRAPEVMLQIPFDEGIDMWSLGLTAAELVAGVPLYPGKKDYDMLNFIIETQGQPADDMLDRGQSTEVFFKKLNNSQQRWRLKTPEEFAKQTGYYGQETRWYRLGCLDDLRELMAETGDSLRDQWLLMDLIKRMLELDPHQCIKPMEVLQHRFFPDSLSQSFTADNLYTIHTEKETPEVSEQFYSYWTEGPENMHCCVKSSCIDSCIEITDNAEKTTEVTLQSCWNQTRGPANIQYWGESDNQSEQCLLVDSIKRILEVDPDQHIKPVEVLQHPVFPDSLSQSFSADNLYTIHTEEATPEVSEQFCSYWTEGPENIHCGVESSCVDPCIEMTDNAEETTEVTQQSSWNQTRGPEKSDCRVDSIENKKKQKKKRKRQRRTKRKRHCS